MDAQGWDVYHGATIDSAIVQLSVLSVGDGLEPLLSGGVLVHTTSKIVRFNNYVLKSDHRLALRALGFKTVV